MIVGEYSTPDSSDGVALAASDSVPDDSPPSALDPISLILADIEERGGSSGSMEAAPAFEPSDSDYGSGQPSYDQQPADPYGAQPSYNQQPADPYGAQPSYNQQPADPYGAQPSYNQQPADPYGAQPSYDQQPADSLWCTAFVQPAACRPLWCTAFVRPAACRPLWCTAFVRPAACRLPMVHSLRTTSSLPTPMVHGPYGAQPSYDQQPADPYGAQPSYDQQPADPYGAQPSYDQQPADSYGAQPSYDQQPADPYGAQPSYDQQPADPYGAQPSYDQQPADPLASLQQRLSTSEHAAAPYSDPAPDVSPLEGLADALAPGIADILSRAEPVGVDAPADSFFMPSQIVEIEPLTSGDDDISEFEQLFNDDRSNTSLLDYLANEYFDRSYFHRSAHVYRMIADLDPSRCDALYFLAESLVKIGQQEDAIPCLASVLSQESDDPQVQIKAQELFDELQHFLEPVAPAQPDMGSAAVNVLSPPNGSESTEFGGVVESGLSAALERADIFSIPDTSDTTDISIIKERLDKDPDNVALLDWYGFRLYSEGMITEAVSVYQRLVNSAGNPTEEAIYYLGNCFLKMYKYREARKTWEHLLELYPDGELAGKARQKLEKLAELEDRDREKRRRASAGGSGMGRMKPKRVVSSTKNKPVKPLSAIGSIVDTVDKASSAKLDPLASLPSVPDEQQVVFTEYHSGDGSGTEEVEKMLSTDPDNPELLDWAAFMNYTNNNFERALELYHKVLTINDDVPQTYYYLGTIYGRLEKYDEAHKYWSILSTRYPDDKVTKKVIPKLDSIKAKAEAMVSSTDSVGSPSIDSSAGAPSPEQAAERTTEQPADPVTAQVAVESVSLELSSQQAASLETLMENPTRDLLEKEREALVLNTGIDKEEMLFHVEAALSKITDSVELEDWAAYLNYSCSHYDKALKHYLTIMKKNPDSPQVYYYVGRILCQQERFKDASKYWKVLCKKYPTSKIAMATKPDLQKLAYFK